MLNTQYKDSIFYFYFDKLLSLLTCIIKNIRKLLFETGLCHQRINIIISIHPLQYEKLAGCEM